MALAPPAVHDRKRVKVYELKSNDWFDRGTGFCTGSLVNDEAHIHVQSEDEPERTLLETKISKDDGYQKQQDTLIVWTEANVTDMALSFQEAEGCAVIWDFISEAQQRLGGVGADDNLSDDIVDPSSIMLPNPDLANLTDIDNAIRLASSGTASRDALARFIIQADYVTKLVPLVEVAEDLESLLDLHKLCTIMKTLILLNDHTVIEQVVTDDLFMGVVGALEYDPDFPTQKANHRHYLQNSSRYKEVVKIEDPDVQKKIHYTYRLQYLKDVVLARILDDGTFTALNSLIYFHQMAILQYVQSNGSLLKELFSLFVTQSTDVQKKKDALHFVQHCCNIAKSLQAGARQALYQSFIPAGLFTVIAFALRQHDAATRVAGTEILGALLDHDATLLRGQISRALSEDKSKPLTDVLIDLLLVETDLGVQSQIADAIKHLLDPMPVPQPNFDPSTRNMEFLAKLRSNHLSQTDNLLSKYYEDATKRLFRPLKDLENRESMDSLSIQEVMLFSHLLDILSVLVKQYTARSRVFPLADPLAPRIAQLLSCSEKHLKLSALKYFRSCIGLHEQIYNRQMIQHRLFEPILGVLFETMPRDNLLNSACLELFEFIKRENFKELTMHLVETYRDRLERITYVNTFRELIDKYEKFIAPLPDNLSFTSVETEQASTGRQMINGGPAARWQGFSDADNDEQGFFSGAEHDVGEDEPQLAGVLKPLPNGPSPMKPLVDYPADDDDDDDDIDILAEDAAAAASRPPPADPPAAPRHETPTPPERLGSEKKRVREDDGSDDELAKAGPQPAKRRSSGSSKDAGSNGNGAGASAAAAAPPALAPNAVPPPAPTRQLRRKHSIGRDGAAAAKRVGVPLAVKSGGEGPGAAAD